MGDPTIDLHHHLGDLEARDRVDEQRAAWRAEAEEDVRRAVAERDLDWLERLLGCDPEEEDLFDEDDYWRERGIQNATGTRYEEIRRYREGD